MADLAALQEAEALLALATDLSRRIDTEIASAEAAVRKARESLARVEATGAAGVEHLGSLGRALRQGGALQETALACLEKGAAAGRALWEAALLPTLLSSSALASSGGLPAKPFQAVLPDLPVFSAPTPEELRQVPLPISPGMETWDLFAAELPVFSEICEKALALLDEAQSETETPRAGRSPRRDGQVRAGERELES